LPAIKSLLREPRWFTLQPASSQDLGTFWRDWLGNAESLTARLLAASKGQFSVRVLNQRIACPLPSEARSLDLGNRQWALIREVILYGKSQPWVFARSVLPLATLTGRLKTLRSLDNRPLGAILFNDRTMTRGAIEIARVPGHLLPDGVAPGHTLWGRRSVFRLDNKPLLVSEIFLPDFDPAQR
jgi:chorismate--pyruvate lyase